MKPELVDHLIAFTIVVVMPLLAMRSFPRILAAIRADPAARQRQYKHIIVSQWSLVAIVLAWWFVAGREPAAIGFAVPLGLRSVIGLAITIALLVVLRFQLVAVRRGGDEMREGVRAQLGAVEVLIPRTDSEARWFGAVGITAGICEEILYRGFLIAYGSAYFGAWPAIAVSTVAFSLGHLYQGRANALKACVFGMLTGVMTVGCGSLLWPMIMHAAIDLHGGKVGRMAVTDSPRV